MCEYIRGIKRTEAKNRRAFSSSLVKDNLSEDRKWARERSKAIRMMLKRWNLWHLFLVSAL